MHLYLLRHADAETHAATDAQRRLTEKGEEQAAEVARFCASHGVTPGIILSSPFVRARRTATIVAEKLEIELREVQWLASGAEPADVVKELDRGRNTSAVMLVGHEPDLGRLASHLLGTSQREAIHVRKASLTALEVLMLREGGARLDFSIPVKFM